MNLLTLEPFEWNDEILKKYELLVNEFANYNSTFEQVESIQEVIGTVYTPTTKMDKTNGKLVTLFMVDNEPVGYVAWFPVFYPIQHRESVWIAHSYIREEHRNKGYYTEFIEQLPKICEESTYNIKPDYIELGVVLHNELSYTVHKSLDFTPHYMVMVKEFEIKSNENDK